ncbi:MAG: hypothetical protein ACO2Z9_01695 [Crocinitomicaceae bacterium]
MLDKKQVLEQFRIPDFVLKTQRQIHKDFSVQGLTVDDTLLEKELDYESIFLIVTDALSSVMRLGERQLLQLNYQIDIPQSQFLKAITEENPIEELSTLIIRREAYKVYLRTKF